MNTSAKIKISVYMAISLDRFIARPDGDVAWLHEGEPLEEGNDAGFGEFFNSIDVLVMGRGSFEKVLEFDSWAYGSKPVIVMSQSLTEVPEKLADVVKIETATPQELVEKLAEEGYKHIYLDGGKLVQSFLREGLIDEMTLTTLPILLGKGIPLFGELENDIHLKHVETLSWRNGFTQSKYQVLKG